MRVNSGRHRSIHESRSVCMYIYTCMYKLNARLFRSFEHTVTSLSETKPLSEMFLLTNIALVYALRSQNVRVPEGIATKLSRILGSLAFQRHPKASLE